MTVKVPVGAKEQILRIRIIRADGSIEDKGIVSYWHKNPLKRWMWHLLKWIRKG